jgi:hypothetical protein
MQKPTPHAAENQKHFTTETFHAGGHVSHYLVGWNAMLIMKSALKQARDALEKQQRQKQV